MQPDLDQADVRGHRAARYSSVFSTCLVSKTSKHVVDLDVLEVLEHDPALQALLDLADVVLESPQGGDLAGPDDGAVADQAHLAVAQHLAVGDQAAGDRAPARRLEELLDLGLADRLLDLLGLEQALHRRAQLLGHLVDHRVGADLDSLALGGATGVGQRADVEADDDRVGGRGEHHVGLVDPAGGGADHVDDDLVLRELGDLVLKRLQRARDVGLDDDRELVELALLRLGEDLLEGDLAGLAPRQLLGLEALGALVGELAGAALVLDHLDPLARLADAVEAEHLDRVAGPSRLDALAGVVLHRAHLSPLGAGDERVADVQRAALDQHRDHRAATGVEVGLDHRSRRRARRGWPSAPRPRRPGRSSRAGCPGPPSSSPRRRRRPSRRPSPRA